MESAAQLRFGEAIVGISTGVGFSVGRDSEQRFTESFPTSSEIAAEIMQHVELGAPTQLLDSTKQDEIVDSVRRSIDKVIQSTITSYVFEKISQKVSNSGIEDILSKTENNLESERKTASARAFLNLILGIIIAIYGVTFISSLFEDRLASQEGGSAYLYFISRIGTVFLIELFAFFFLNLYRIGMQEARYIQNEITNVSARRAAVQMAMFSNDVKLYADTVNVLLSTERNFILKKGEKTSKIAEIEALQNFDLAVVEKFTRAIDKKNPRD